MAVTLQSVPMAEPTNMGIALRKGGVLPIGERLSELFLDACRTHTRPGAQRAHVTDALRGELTYALLQDWKPSVIGEMIGYGLDRARKQLDAEARAENPDVLEHAHAAAAARHRRTDLPEQEPIVLNMPSPVTTWDREGRFANDEARAATRANALFRTAVKLSKLDSFMVNGQPIGDLTPEEANGWAGSRERDASFVRMLTAGLPPGRPIRLSRNGDDVDALWEAAEAERTKE
jgi:hypothetical protein